MFAKLNAIIKTLNSNASLRCRHGNVEFTAGGIVGVLAIVAILGLFW